MDEDKASNRLEDLSDPSELIRSARALLAELSEEGVAEYERLDPPESIGKAVPQTDAAAAATNQKQTTPDRPRAARPAAQPERAAPPSVAAQPVSPGVAEPVPWFGRVPSLEEVSAHLGPCTRCGLCEGRQSIVFGDGNPNADLMFIGEAPGEQEDRRGLPFVGRAGDLLTQMLEKGIGISRSDVYICNIVKCRPPGNRNPLPPEVSACRPFLEGQIAAIAPKVIVTLGKPASSLLLGRDVAITRERGTWHDYKGIPLMPTLHPAYVLRQYTAENRRAVWEDLRAARERSQSN